MLVDLSIGRRAPDCIINIDYIFERSIPEPNTGCWLWLGSVAGRYPSMGFGGRTARVSRVVFELTNGRPPQPGMYVCHSCDTTICVNPDHLWEGTPSNNVQDAIAKGRHVAPRRDRHGMAKFTTEQAANIVADPRSNRELSNLLNVNITTIRRIRYSAIALAKTGATP